MLEYVVKPNDTMYSIAKEFRIPLVQLVGANPELANPNTLREGQTITIPDLLPIPEQLEFIDSAVRNMIDNIYITEWQTVESTVNKIKTAMGELVPFLKEALVPGKLISGMEMTVGRLEQNVLNKKVFSALSQANLLTLYVADILDYFGVVTPTDLQRLGFLGRQIIINVELKDWPEAHRNYLRAKNIWERIKPELSENYSMDVAEFGQMLDNLNESINRKDYTATINSVNTMLDGVEKLVADFEQINTD